MKIAVCIKRVPDSETRVKIAPDGKSLDEAGVKFILNPYDEFAIEEALRRKEQAGAGEVVVLSPGPAAAPGTLRPALPLGAAPGSAHPAPRAAQGRSFRPHPLRKNGDRRLHPSGRPDGRRAARPAVRHH